MKVCCVCSPFDSIDTASQYSHSQQSAFTDHTTAPLYANDVIANSGTFYEEISTDHGAGTMRMRMRALYDYDAVEDDELSLSAGEISCQSCCGEQFCTALHCWLRDKSVVDLSCLHHENLLLTFSCYRYQLAIADENCKSNTISVS